MKKVAVILISLMFSTGALAAGTNVSSGFSWTIGNSHTKVTEWSNYTSHGCGISVSVDSNAGGYDYRQEVYGTSSRNSTRAKGTVDGVFSSVDYTSSAGILRSSTGVRVGATATNMQGESRGYKQVNGRYVQISEQDGAYNYEQGRFYAESGYSTESSETALTAYVGTYTNTEFDY